MTRRNTIRLAVYVPLLAVLAWRLPPLVDAYTPFTPPNEEKRVQAIGNLSRLPPDLQQVFRETNAFKALPEPGPNDWLISMGRMDRHGQTVGNFKRGRRNKLTSERRTLYILPCDIAITDIPGLLSSLQTFTQAYFQLPVRVLSPLDLSNLQVTSRENNGVQQRLTTDILELLKERVPHDAYSVIALTLTDLYPGKNWNFVFGQASLKDRVGVFSLARYGERTGFADPDQVTTTFLKRACKVLAHETGHMFGAKHCIHYHCILNGSGSLPETDRSPLHAGPVCLRKLHLAIEFDPIQRYHSLLDFYQSNSFDSEAPWIEQRLSECAR